MLRQLGLGKSLTLHLGQQEIAADLASHLDVSNHVSIATGALHLPDLQVCEWHLALSSAD